MNKLKYIEGSKELLAKVEPLWKKLNSEHAQKTLYFKNDFLNNTFDERKESLIQKSKNGKLKIFIVESLIEKSAIAYCISSVIQYRDSTIGEIDSIFIQEAFRNNGIGKRLINSSLAWFKEMKATRVISDVAIGNEDVIEFYKKSDFYPRSVLIEYKPLGSDLSD